MNTDFIRKIIILRFRRVGDAVLSSSLCSSLRKTFPEAAIDYVLNAEIAPLFENHPDIDRIISFENREMKDWAAYLKKVHHIMQAGKYDLIVDTRATLKTLWFSLFSLSSSYRIGRKKSYNRFIHNFRPDTAIDDDEIGRTLQLLSPLEKDYQTQYDRNFKVYVTSDEKESFRRQMQAKGIDFSRPVMICAVTARLTYKVWKMEYMRELLQRIIDHYDVQLIFNYGGLEEEDAAIRLQQEMGNPVDVFTNIRAGNLRELAAMLANSDFFFGNEGGPRHISQALNIPSFAIYPPEISKKKWLPNACDRFQGIEPCDVSDKAKNEKLSYRGKFEFITTDEVWTRLQPMLCRFLNKK
ncbi:MAG: glycosyltransferase family 9 protein [Dysgonamonadaceae bacterium]|jgi:heptosyltransferase-2|nr:glycosyltransferase family 9 protein [Dysgonamonadaceae bacterium]